MKTSTISFLTLALAVSAAPLRRQTSLSSADVEAIVALIPDLGVHAPLTPNGRGDCFGPVPGANGQNISVPCSCPPDRVVYIDALVKNVLAGAAVNNTAVKMGFPLGNTTADAQARITAAEITLQNLQGPGVGCPASATTLGAQSKALAAGGNSTSLSPLPISSTASAILSSTAAATSLPSASGLPSSALIASLAPSLGATPPLPPTGFGDCIGPVHNASVPCDCPPPHAAYLAALAANVLAGHAVNNTGVKVVFPTGNSTQDAHARITAAAVTLQNLEGPGVGCPLTSTTLGVQAAALDAPAV